MKPRRSLLSKVVVLVTVAYFGIEVITLLPFAVLYRTALLDDRQIILEKCAQRGLTAFEESQRHGIAPIQSQIATAPLLSLHGPQVKAFIFTNQTGQEVLQFNSNWELTPAPQVTDEVKRAQARLQSFVDGEKERESERIAQDLVHYQKIEKSGQLQAVMYFAVTLDDIEQRVLKFSAISFFSGLVALIVFGIFSIVYLRATFLAPLQLLIQADNAGRRGDFKEAIIEQSLIPDDELGIIMHSRNRLQIQQQNYRESIAAKTAELARQREALKSWGRELERLVKRKGEDLVKARELAFENEKFAALGRLAANVAHEINNPLASIAGYAEELRDLLNDLEDWQHNPETVHFPEALRIIEDQAFRCKDILKRLLGLARTDKIKISSLDVGDLVRETVTLTEASARKRGVKLTLRGPKTAGPMIDSDSGALVQVVTNLIENAVDAANAAAGSRDEPGAVEVSVATRKEPGLAEECIIRVSDNGFGVPEDLKEKIFDEFYTTKPIGRGTGLGLAICQTMTKRLGGRIEVESLTGTGAAFSIVLPFQFSGPLRDQESLPERPDAARTASFQFADTNLLPENKSHGPENH